MSGLPVPPEVSVIIPVYNVASYLSACLDSVLGQTFTDIEIICVDDGSSDRSSGILADYARKDARLKITTQEHGGQARARNKALSLAQGRYISFVDADDFLNPETIEKVLTFFSKEVDYVCFRARVFNEAGLSANNRKSSYFDPHFLGLVDLDEAVIRRTNVHVWNKIYRREIIDQNQITFPDGLFYEDFTFTLAYLLVSRRGFYMEDRLYTYRLRPDSTMARTRRTSFEHASHHIAVVMRLFEFMKERGILSSHESMLADYFMKHFYITWQYAPVETREGIYELAGRCLKKFDADFKNKNTIVQALLREVTENRHKLNQIVASPWHRVGRTLGLVKRLKDMEC